MNKYSFNLDKTDIILILFGIGLMVLITALLGESNGYDVANYCNVPSYMQNYSYDGIKNYCLSNN